MIAGIVSNCWRTQLAAGANLEDLVAEAFRRGYRAIELRQTCLGRFETAGDHRPLSDPLAELPAGFSGIRFNIAVQFPYFDPSAGPDDPLFTAGKWAAQAVAGEAPPHLRLVDLTTSATTAAAADVGRAIARLTRSLIEIDGVLSLENCFQPWVSFRAAFDQARSLLGQDAGRLRLCYDPCNLCYAGDGVDPQAVTGSLTADELAMVHFKQRRNGQSMADVAAGDVDWSEQGALLRQAGYLGPGLFEIEPGDDIWQRLEASRDYLRERGWPL